MNNTFLNEKSHTPHPFIIDFDSDENSSKTFFKKKDNLIFRIIAIGDGQKYLPYLIYSFIELGKKGIGRNYGKFELVSVKNNDTNIYDPEKGNLSDHKFSRLDYGKIINEESGVFNDTNMNLYV